MKILPDIITYSISLLREPILRQEFNNPTQTQYSLKQRVERKTKIKRTHFSQKQKAQTLRKKKRQKNFSLSVSDLEEKPWKESRGLKLSCSQQKRERIGDFWISWVHSHFFLSFSLFYKDDGVRERNNLHEKRHRIFQHMGSIYSSSSSSSHILHIFNFFFLKQK